MDGSVSEATVVGGKSPFREATLAAASGWRFEPATRNGVPIPARIRFAVEFIEEQRPAPGDGMRCEEERFGPVTIPSIGVEAKF